MKKTDIAIIGMSCIFPGAADVASFWQNIINKVDATQIVPEDRIDKVFFDPNATAIDRFYCNRGGFIPDFEFDAAKFGILPVAVEGIEPDHLLTLSLVHTALEDAGVFEKKYSLQKTGIIIGKGNYAGPGATRAIEIVRTGEQIVNILKNVLPGLGGEELDLIKKEFQQQKGRFSTDTVMGLIPNLVASLVANRLNLGGVAYTVDAACASALIAVDHAKQELNSGRCDMVIAGGVHVGQNAAFWSIFNQLGALSKKGRITPFDERADGLLIGEGCGFVVLKRLDDAIAQGDKIYAVLKGVGISSDGNATSVMSPSVSGQLKAIQQAWDSAGTTIADIGYIEAHGTGTPLGDKTEMETLSAFFGTDHTLPKAGIGTVKSNIGHTMPASGIAGLIKTALALHHGIIPPTLYCDNPLQQMQHSRFRIVQEAEDWSLSGLPKLAGVNAFGFGGINAHAVLEGYALNSHLEDPEKNCDPVLVIARHSLNELVAALENRDKEVSEGRYRVVVFNPTTERVAKAIKIVLKDKPWRNKQDIWFSNAPLLSDGGKIAFMFPGLDGLSAGEVDTVAQYLDLQQEDIIRTEGLLNDALKVFNKTNILDHALKKLGVVPDLCAGHSLGEWQASRSAGLVEESAIMDLLRSLNPENYELKDSKFIAVGCGIEQLQPVIDHIDQLYLSNDNCPQQIILCGSTAALELLLPILKQRQIFHQVLPFQSGFHTPFLATHLDLILTGMRQLRFHKTTIPLWSATTLKLYPEKAEEIMELSAAHLLKPVRFRELTQQLYEEGARVFIQIGSGGLTGFIDDTLRGKNISTLSASISSRSGIKQLQRVLAALFAEGHVGAMHLLENKETKQHLVKSKQPHQKGIQLKLGLPLISHLNGLKSLSVSANIKLNSTDTIQQEHPHPLIQIFNDNMDQMKNVQAELLHLFQHRTEDSLPLQAIRSPFSMKLDISLSNCPYLIDHCIMRQPEGWECLADMDPVIPMTMIFEIFAETAAAQFTEGKVNKIMNIKVFQWMNVTQPFTEIIHGNWKDQHTLHLSLERFAEADVSLSNKFSTLPSISQDMGKLLSISKTKEQIYQEHMFHGPGYQGIQKLIAIGDKGITGLIEGGAGKGSLLDNAGQLFGLWLQLTLDKDRIAFPVKIQEIEFFSDFNDQQGSFECSCFLTELTAEFATANFIISRDGLAWAQVKGWQNRRMGIDEPLWNVSMAPQYHQLSEEIAPHVFMFHHAYNRVASWDFVLKRYFNQSEKKHYESLAPNRKKEWMISRVAVKDAVKTLLFRNKKERVYPIVFEIRSDSRHQPYPYGSMTDGIHISIAHKGTDAVGIARYNKAVGIDIETIEERGEGFYDLVFSADELSLLKDHEKSEWATRFWVAKEAYGKYLGKGLQGNPRAYVIEAVNGETLRINDILIQTIKHKNYIIGWTL